MGTHGNLWEPVGTRYLIEALIEEEIEQKAQKMLLGEENLENDEEEKNERKRRSALRALKYTKF